MNKGSLYYTGSNIATIFISKSNQKKAFKYPHISEFAKWHRCVTPFYKKGDYSIYINNERTKFVVVKDNYKFKTGYTKTGSFELEEDTFLLFLGDKPINDCLEEIHLVSDGTYSIQSFDWGFRGRLDACSNNYDFSISDDSVENLNREKILKMRTSSGKLNKKFWDLYSKDKNFLSQFGLFVGKGVYYNPSLKRDMYGFTLLDLIDE